MIVAQANPSTPSSEASSRAWHVVLGAGQIGSRVAELLAARGNRVRLVRQSSHTARSGIETRSGNIAEPEFAEAAMAGAAVVYDCMNPPYHRWPELLLPIARGALLGATRASAKLVALDCLYMYGRPTGALDEDSPLVPCSKKGELRVQLAELRLAAHRRGDLTVAIGRASDFFGANLPYSGFSDRFYRRILSGKAAECMGDPDMPHSHSYVEDVARALITLADRNESSGKVWHLPSLPAESTRALVERLGHALSLSVRVERLPRWVLHVAGLFQPFLREIKEMTYQWEVPFVLDDSRFRKAFGHGATPIEVAVADTAAWARRHYGIASPRA